MGELKDLVTRMLSKNFLQRPTVKEVSDHSWFTTAAGSDPPFHASILASLAKRDQARDP